MNYLPFLTKDQQATLIAFLKANKYISFVLVFIFLLFFSLFVSSFTSFPQNQQTSNQPVPRITTYQVKPTSGEELVPSGNPSEEKAGSEQPNEEHYEKWAPTVFSETFMNDVSYDKKTLSDGSTSYTYASHTPSRQDMIIVKNGIVIFKRMVLSQMKVTNYFNAYKKPDYIVQGSHFYGPDAVTYIYFERGAAFVGNPKTNVAFEDLEFKPVPPNEYKKLYGEDLIGDLKKY